MEKKFRPVRVGFFLKKSMALDLETHPGYHPGKVITFFERRGWEVEPVNVSNVDLVVAEQGAATECIDGRFGRRERIKMHGPKIPGGINAVAALKTGGDRVGFNAAAAEVVKLGFRAGTHRHCGFFDLWESGQLPVVKHVLELPGKHMDRAKWIDLKAKHWGGNHFYLPGEHVEEGLVLNPFIGYTTIARPDRFGYDDWFMHLLGIHGRRSMLLVAQTVENLSPHRKIEILSK